MWSRGSWSPKIEILEAVTLQEKINEFSEQLALIEKVSNGLPPEHNVIIRKDGNEVQGTTAYFQSLK